MIALTRLSGYAHVAVKYGVDEALFLDSIMYWYRHNRANDMNFHDGRWWTYNSMAAFVDLFPWWSDKQLRRIIKSCKEQGALLTANYNSDGRDRTVWYSPSDELLQLYGDSQTGECICPNGQMQMPKQADASAQTGEPLPCNYIHVDNIPPITPPQGEASPKRKRRETKSAPNWEPERFAGFWAMYPRGEKKQAAIQAWDNLRPSGEVIDTMARALKRQVASEEWQRGVGIPYASTYLNQRRWEDEVKAPAKQVAPITGGARVVTETTEVPEW